MNSDQIKDIVNNVIEKENSDAAVLERKARVEKLNSRIAVIDKMIPKLYNDNAEGRLEDARLRQMVDDLQKEAVAISDELLELSKEPEPDKMSKKYERFFELTKKYSHIDTLNRDILLTFVDRIEVGPKVFENGLKKATHRNTPFKQSVKIFYKFIGEIDSAVA